MFPGATVILTSALDSDDLIEQGRAWGTSECIDKLSFSRCSHTPPSPSDKAKREVPRG